MVTWTEIDDLVQDIHNGESGCESLEQIAIQVKEMFVRAFKE